jgi:DNA-(apurinic or apyrimidinic site) lyase
MEHRITRSMTLQRATVLPAPNETAKSQLSSTLKTSGKNKSENLLGKKEVAIKNSTKRTGTKRKRQTIQKIDIDELPHNLGKIPAAVVDNVFEASKSAFKQDPELLIDEKAGLEADTELGASGKTIKAKKKRSPYGLTPGVSPFPDFPHPTPEECEEVDRLLSTVHGEIAAPATVPQPSLTVTGCGEVPSVLDALIRTLLSGATTSANSARAFQGLVQKFGILQEGVGKGSVDWDAVRRAPVDDVFQAMKSGGLAAMKSRYLKEILDMVYKENIRRRDALLKAETNGADGPAGVENETDAAKQKEIDCANENVLSLDYIHALDKDQAMLEFVKFPGIGPKTAACVILFCLQRPCFAVDTHIFRICKWLGWIPSEKVNEVAAFSHLEVRIPDHLKYSLHQLFIRHGRTCPRCRAITGEGSEGWDQGCVIDHLVKRTGKRKGGLELNQRKMSAKTKRRQKAESSDDEDEGQDMSDVLSDNDE